MLHKNKRKLFFLLTLLQGLCSAVSADVIHITSGISVAPGSEDALLWNLNPGEDSTTDIYFTFGDFAGGVRDLNDPAFAANYGPATGELLALKNDASLGDDIVKNLPARFVVGPSVPDDYHYIASRGSLVVAELDTLSGFQPNVPGYIGFRFTAGINDVRYGWAKFMVTFPDPVTSLTGAPGITISEWAYETNGGPISVPVPEPSTIGLLTSAAGAATLRRWRRRRRNV